MTYLNLSERIEKSEKAIKSYPEWAKNGCKFQGGGVTRSGMTSNDDKKKQTHSSGDR